MLGWHHRVCYWPMQLQFYWIKLIILISHLILSILVFLYTVKICIFSKLIQLGSYIGPNLSFSFGLLHIILHFYNHSIKYWYIYEIIKLIIYKYYEFYSWFWLCWLVFKILFLFIPPRLAMFNNNRDTKDL